MTSSQYLVCLCQQTQEEAVAKALEGAHMAAAHELGGLWHKRLQLEVARNQAATRVTDDAKFALEEQLQRSQEAHKEVCQLLSQVAGVLH